MRQSLYFFQVIKSKGGKESETEYFAALVNIHVFFFILSLHLGSCQILLYSLANEPLFTRMLVPIRQALIHCPKNRRDQNSSSAV